MPTYDYECSYCGQILELSRRIANRNDPLTHHHEEAGRILNAPMRRVFSSPAIQFHGPGVTRGSEAKGHPPEHESEGSTA
jgi:putative FmdB family regulatory protein